MYNALGIMKDDSARTIRAKAEFLALKGKYDQEVFRAWSKFSKDPNNSYRDFLASDQFDQILFRRRSTAVQLYSHGKQTRNICVPLQNQYAVFGLADIVPGFYLNIVTGTNCEAVSCDMKIVFQKLKSGLFTRGTFTGTTDNIATAGLHLIFDTA